jgi:hypothetical protein
MGANEEHRQNAGLVIYSIFKVCSFRPDPRWLRRQLPLPPETGRRVPKDEARRSSCRRAAWVPSHQLGSGFRSAVLYKHHQWGLGRSPGIRSIICILKAFGAILQDLFYVFHPEKWFLFSIITALQGEMYPCPQNFSRSVGTEFFPWRVKGTKPEISRSGGTCPRLRSSHTRRLYMHVASNSTRT